MIAFTGCDPRRYMSGCDCAKCQAFAVSERAEARRLDESDRRRYGSRDA